MTNRYTANSSLYELHGLQRVVVGALEYHFDHTIEGQWDTECSMWDEYSMLSFHCRAAPEWLLVHCWFVVVACWIWWSERNGRKRRVHSVASSDFKRLQVASIEMHASFSTLCHSSSGLISYRNCKLKTQMKRSFPGSGHRTWDRTQDFVKVTYVIANNFRTLKIWSRIGVIPNTLATID